MSSYFYIFIIIIITIIIIIIIKFFRNTCYFISNFITNHVSSSHSCFLNCTFSSCFYCVCCRHLLRLSRHFWPYLSLKLLPMFLTKDKNPYPFTYIISLGSTDYLIFIRCEATSVFKHVRTVFI